MDARLEEPEIVQHNFYTGMITGRTENISAIIGCYRKLTTLWLTESQQLLTAASQYS